ENHGQIYATDSDKRRLAPIHARLERAGARNVQVRTPRTNADVLADLVGRADLVLIDAPCTGIGAWRRNPDAKWRGGPGPPPPPPPEQEAAPGRAAAPAEPGGGRAYLTPSGVGAGDDEQHRAAFSPPPGVALPPPPPL